MDEPRTGTYVLPLPRPGSCLDLTKKVGVCGWISGPVRGEYPIGTGSTVPGTRLRV